MRIYRVMRRNGSKKKDMRWFLAGGLMLLMSVILQGAARNIPGFGQNYAVTIYPLLVESVGRLFGLVSFSVAELGLYGLGVFCLVYGFSHIGQIRTLCSRTLALAAALFLVYTLNCGINYYRKPFSDYLEFDIQDSTEDELKALCRYLTDQVNQAVAQKDAEAGGFIGKEGIMAMQNLGTRYPQLGGFYPRPKPVTVSWILSVQQLGGIYLPFTIEANYNREMPEYNIPHTICHELSHLKGFMREDEANFIGYLACIESKSPQFRYSGYLTGWVYAGNALARTDADAYFEIYEQLDPQAVMDLTENNRFWNQYEGKIAETATKLNDTYLKMNDQSHGVRSYGLAVDLMLSYYRQQGLYP